MQVQELVGIVPWTFIAQICNLFLQMYLIKRFLFKPVNEMLQKRRAMADAEIQDATKAKEEALAMKTEYEQNMQQAKAKASDIVTEAQRTASLQSEEILKSAAQEARAMKEKAESDIAQEKRKAVNEVKNEIGVFRIDIIETCNSFNDLSLHGLLNLLKSKRIMAKFLIASIRLLLRQI